MNALKVQWLDPKVKVCPSASRATFVGLFVLRCCFGQLPLFAIANHFELRYQSKVIDDFMQQNVAVLREDEFAIFALLILELSRFFVRRDGSMSNPYHSFSNSSKLYISKRDLLWSICECRIRSRCSKHKIIHKSATHSHHVCIDDV